MEALCLFLDPSYCFYPGGKMEIKVIKMLICFLTAAPETKKQPLNQNWTVTSVSEVQSTASHPDAISVFHQVCCKIRIMGSLRHGQKKKRKKKRMIERKKKILVPLIEKTTTTKRQQTNAGRKCSPVCRSLASCVTQRERNERQQWMWILEGISSALR